MRTGEGKVISSNKIKGIRISCTICKDECKMVSTGKIYCQKLESGTIMTHIEFICPTYNEIIKKYNIKYKDLIQEILKDNGIN